MTKQRAIYLKCLDCSGGSAKEVTLCVVFDCPLWEYRCGYHVSSGKYRKRIHVAFSRYAKDVKELQRQGINMADFLLEGQHACVFPGKPRKKEQGKGEVAAQRVGT